MTVSTEKQAEHHAVLGTQLCFEAPHKCDLTDYNYGHNKNKLIIEKIQSDIKAYHRMFIIMLNRFLQE
jgi:hypothetical protein